MASIKLLLFSDIHTDWKTLESILSVEADYYIAAGDQVSWARGLDRCGEILRTRGEKVWVLPGNHESAAQIAAMCERYGLNNFHERHFAGGRWNVAGLGYSSPTPFDTPGEYTEAQIAERLAQFADSAGRWCWYATRRHTRRRWTRSAPGCTPGRRRCAISSSANSPSISSAATSMRPRATIAMGGTRARNVGKKGVFARIGLNPHDIR